MYLLLTRGDPTITIVAAPIATQATEVALSAIENSHQTIQRNAMAMTISSRFLLRLLTRRTDSSFQKKNRPNTMHTYPSSFLLFMMPAFVAAPVQLSKYRPNCGKYLMKRIESGRSR